MAAVVFVLALLMPAVLGSSPSDCLNATIPNILNIGECIGNSLDLCNGTPEDVLDGVVQVVVCLIDALLELNLLGALAALLEILEIVLSVLGLSLGTLTRLIKPLCAITRVSGCKTILSGGETCKEPITVTLPGDLNLAECIDDTLLLCENGELATDELLGNLLKTLACLLNTLITSDSGNLINGLACAVVDLLGGIAASATLTLKTPLLALSATIKASAQCS